MCGIVGFFNKNNAPASEEKLIAMNNAIIHRGPDAGGIFVEDNLALGHRRLSILDLSEGANQPFYSPCGNFILVFNGEIFNYKSFYPELKAKGYSFQTTSDTEVLLFLLMEYGLKVLDKLNGFFAFALWDKSEKSLTLVKDRFGVKPLFYIDNPTSFAFASEPKALFAGNYNKKIAENYLDELFFYRFVSGANTIFEGIKRLEPGHYMVLKDNGKHISFHRWFHLGEAAANFGEIRKPLDWFSDTFHDSVKLRMISDVPVGTMLSGGLDSSSILYSQHHQKFSNLSSWNIRFSNYENDESSLAQQLSHEYNADYNGFEFVGDEQVELLRQCIHFNDEPLMHFTDNVLLGLAKKAKSNVTVLLTGEGADEVLGGYVRYKVFGSSLTHSLIQNIRYFPDSWLKSARLKKMKRYLMTKNTDFQILTNANEMYMTDFKKLGILSSNLLPDYRVRVLEEAKQFYPNSHLRQLLYLEQHTHLFNLNDKNDRTTMGASIECREPYLDYRLVTGVASLPDSYFSTRGKGKLLSMKTLGEKLPDYIQNHRKIGLAIPWDKYILENPVLRDHLENMHHSPLFELGFLKHLEIEKMVKCFKSGETKHLGFLRQLFFNSFWYKEIFERNEFIKQPN